MARSQPVIDGLWGLVGSLLPGRMLQRTGRPRVSDRATFTVIMFVLMTGVPWRMVPQQIGCPGSPLGGGCGSGSVQECGSDCTAKFSAA